MSVHSSVMAQETSGTEPGFSLAAVRDVLATDLAPVVEAIDAGDLYPAAVMRRLGAVGAWRQHLPVDGKADL